MEIGIYHLLTACYTCCLYIPVAIAKIELAENHENIDSAFHMTNGLPGEGTSGLDLVGIPNVQPEVLGSLLRRSIHKPLCVLYKGKVNLSFEQKLSTFWEELTTDAPYSSWILKGIQSQEPLDTLPVLRCYLGPAKSEDYEGKATIKHIHRFLIQLNQRRLLEADPATIDSVISNSDKLTSIVFLGQTKHFDIESDLIQLQETFRNDLLILLVHPDTPDEMPLLHRFQVTSQPAIIIVNGKEWRAKSQDILQRFEGPLATVTNTETFLILYLSSIAVLNLDTFQTEVLTPTESLSPILVSFHAMWGQDVAAYVNALQRSADRFEQLGAQLRFGAVDLTMQQEVVYRWVNATYVKAIPFSVLFWWTQESNQEPALQQRLFSEGIPTPWTVADFMKYTGVPLLDKYGNHIRYSPWEDDKVSYGFSTWSSMPCVSSANTSDISGDLSCDPGLARLKASSDVLLHGEYQDLHDEDRIGMNKILPEKPSLPRVTDSTWFRIIEQSHTQTKDLRQLTEVWKGDITPTIVVVFIQEGCSSCNRKMEMFDALAESVSYIEGGSVYLHNCTSDPVTCNRLNIRGFPTLVAFRGYGQITSKRCVSIKQQAQYIRMDYHGVLEEEHIMDWLSEISVAAVQKLTLLEFEDKKQMHDVVLLATLYPHSIARQYLPIISGPDSWYPYECYRVACERLYGKATCYAALTKNLQKRDVQFSQEEQRMVVTQVEMFRRDGVHSMVFSLGRTLIKSLQDESDKQLHQFHSPHRYNLRPSQRCEDDHSMCTDLIASFVRDHSRLPVTHITLASFHTHGSTNLDVNNDGSIHTHGHPVLIALGHTSDIAMESPLLQALTESAYQLYNKMVFVALNVDEFPQWASHFVPQGYSRQIFENSDAISEDVLPSLYVYPRLCIIHEEDHRHAAFYPSAKEFALMPRDDTRQFSKEEILRFAEHFLQDPDEMLMTTEQF